MRIFIFCLVSILLFKLSADESHCRAFYKSSAVINTASTNLPANNSLNNTQPLFQIAMNQMQFFCKNASEKNNCLTLGAKILTEAFSCLSEKLSVKELRPLVTAYLRNNEFKNLVLPALLNSSQNLEQNILRQQIWNEFHVLVLEAGPTTQDVSLGLSKNFSTAELKLLQAGYRRLRDAITQRVGAERVAEFSHLWGSYGVLARVGEKSIRGQFGEVYSEFPFQVNVVVNVVEENFTAVSLAQRIAHENAHSQDGLLGAYRLKEWGQWSESRDLEIIKACTIPEGQLSLMSCYRTHTTWFNFHPTNYAATNTAEFYGKMMDEWVRESSGVFPYGHDRYRCQNKQTEKFWKELEENLIGESLSADCQVK